ncbi:MAG TPA: sigma-54 dependent transcriptional regulator [Acidobacteriota bacterium]
MRASILVVDDEKNLRASVEQLFGLEGYATRAAASGTEALALLERTPVDLVILDLNLGDLDGLEVLRRIREQPNPPAVIILTAYGSTEKAVQAIKSGAFDFVEKPPARDRLLVAAQNALRLGRLASENRELRDALEGRFEMVGTSAAMRALYARIERAAPTQATILISGESGTGKELVARALVAASARSDRPLVKVNCAALPADLIESELFGHERGAFTGASERRLGRFERAHGGTLLLDEVGELPLGLQSKLLRVLESGEIERVGGSKEITVDVRLIAATNRDLEAEVRAGRFREDLFYRLNVVPLPVPPLRQRREDIPLLIEHFRLLSARIHNCRPLPFEPAAIELLRAHDFPGNIRELRNTVERLLILAGGPEITAREVAAVLTHGRHDPLADAAAADQPLRQQLERFERAAILARLQANDWRMSETARQLGLERSHLYKKLRTLKIDRPE